MQLSFDDAEGLEGRKRTRHEVLPAQMEQVAPWKGLRALIEPHDPKRGPPRPTALRLGDDAAHPLLAAEVRAVRYGDGGGARGLPVMRRFAQLGGMDDIPDETTILNFRRLPETLAGRRRFSNSAP